MQIDLLLPGLFDRLDDWSRHYAPLPSFPVLESLLARARVSATAAGFEATLWARYDPAWRPDQELPSAATLTGNDAGTVLHASPVHLDVGIDDLLLSRPEPAVTDDEYRAIADCLNAHLDSAGGRFDFDDGLGYLCFDRSLELRTTPLSQVAGMGIKNRQPTGPDAPALQRLATEIQMLLHTAPFNQRRERLGQTTINALWLWGATREKRALAPRHDRLLADDPFSRACAKAAGQHHDSLPARWCPTIAAEHRLLIVIDELRTPSERDDIGAWIDALQTIERQWLGPIQQSLQAGEVTRLTLSPCHGKTFSVNRHDRWKFWRRPRPLSALA